MKYDFLDQAIIRIPINPLKVGFSKEDIKQLFSKSKEQEALFLSSPVLLTECVKWLNGAILDKTEEDNLA